MMFHHEELVVMRVGMRFKNSLWLAFFLYCVVGQVQASGYAWLKNQEQANGSIVSTANSTVEFQSTAEAIISFQAQGLNVDNNSYAYLMTQNRGAMSIEHLSFRSRILYKRDKTNSLDIQEILKRQNSDGGFGAFQGYESSTVDTAHAVRALYETDLDVEQYVALAAGYLISKQIDSGAWTLGGERLDPYVTAVVMKALWGYRNQYSIDENLDKAQSYLMSLRNQDGSWVDLELTSLAILAILPRLSDKRELLTSIDYLETQQNSDLNWLNDAYITALALRAQSLATQIDVNPDISTLKGRLVSEVDSQPISGLILQLAGDQSYTLTTNASGVFQIENIVTGEYLLTFNSEVYGSFTSPVFIEKGSKIDLGEIQLATKDGSQTVTVRGVTFLTKNGVSTILSGVRVKANGKSAVSDEDGRYEIKDLPPGDIVVSAIPDSGINVSRIIGTQTVVNAKPGDLIVFSPVLFSSFGQDVPRVFGLPRDATNNKPIRYSVVDIKGATNARYGTTFTFTAGLNIGVSRITILANGYQPASIEVSAVRGQRFEFNPRLYPEGSGSTLLQGQVINKALGSAQNDLTVQLTGANTRVTKTSGVGFFAFENLNAGETTITVSGDNFKSVSKIVDIKTADNIGVPFLIEPVDYSPVGTTVDGRVITDTRLSAAGAVVKATQDDNEVIAVTDVLGKFVLDGINRTGNWKVIVSLGNYDITESQFYMPNPIEPVSLGDITLKEKIKLPDLVVGSISRQAMISDVANFNVDGSVAVVVYNQGTKELNNGFESLVYYDVDRNSNYNENQDVLLGQYHYEGVIGIEKEITLTIPVAGQLPFRDPPIRVRLDVKSEVIELREDNNDRGSCETARCGD